MATISGRLDILIISESKIDSSFPSSLFHVEGFCLCRCNRKAGGGRLMVFIRSDICFIRVKELKGLSLDTWSAFKTQLIVLKLKLPNVWISVVGIYTDFPRLRDLSGRRSCPCFLKQFPHSQVRFSWQGTSMQTSLLLINNTGTVRFY